MSVEGFVRSENQYKKELNPVTMSYTNELEIELTKNCTITIKPTKWYDPYTKFNKYHIDQKNMLFTKHAIILTIIFGTFGILAFYLT